MKSWRINNPKLKSHGLAGIELKTWTPPVVRCSVSRKLVQLELPCGSKRWYDVKHLECLGAE